MHLPFAILAPLQEAYQDTNDEVRPFCPFFALPEGPILATIVLARLCVAALDAEK